VAHDEGAFLDLLGRALHAVEHTALDAAVSAATHDATTPTLAHVVSHLHDPRASEGLRRINNRAFHVQDQMTAAEFETFDTASRMRRFGLTVSGALRYLPTDDATSPDAPNTG
jgi:hypothetical protein